MSQFDRIVLAVHDHVAPSAEEWTRFLDLRHKLPGREARVLVESEHGAGPDARQRKELAQATRGLDMRAAIMTDNAIVRGIVTVLSWTGSPQRAFLPGEFRLAAEFLGLADVELARAIEEMSALREQLGWPRHVLGDAP